MRFLTYIFILIFAQVASAAVTFRGLVEKAVDVSVEASTGLDAGVHVLPVTSGVFAVVPQPASGAFTVSKFSNLGAAYAQEIASELDGSDIVFSVDNGDMGYMVEQGSARTCFWVVDYAAHELTLGSIKPGDVDCSSTNLIFEGDAEEISYYSITGRRMLLSRELKVEYTNLQFNDESFSYSPGNVVATLDYIGEQVHLPALLCNSTFHLYGDRFLKAWGREESIESELITPVAVEAHARATQLPSTADNEQRDSNTDNLGGSAPCDISFEAVVSDAAVFTEWQLSRSPSFDIVDLSFSDLTFDFTFRDAGSTYVRFIADNADGTCPFESETFDVFVGDSKLDIPNAFSPDASPGVNDEWKVSYKSLVSYHCEIFNRYGTRMFSSSNPADGWDGRYGGKYVPAGVYFYVIKAVGADGKKYDKAGDINIIKYKQGTSNSNSNSEE